MAIEEGVGNILNALKETDQLDNTVIVLASDNGYFYGEHGLSVERRLAYEESIRMPLLIRYPTAVKAGTVRDEFALNIDLAPTLLELSGVSAPNWMEGRSLVPLLKGARPEWRKSFLIEYYSDKVFPRIRQMGYKAVRNERWKYIHYSELEGMDELYDLKIDPFEMRNVIHQPRVAKILEEMKRDMLALSVSTAAQQPEMSACDLLNGGLGSVDFDRDGIENCKDNCVLDANRDQKDSDGNGTGDVCEWRERQRKEWDEFGREQRRQAREPVDLPKLISKSSDVVLGRLTNERWREPAGLVIKVEVIRRFKDSTNPQYQRFDRPMWIVVPDGGPLELVDELLLFLRNDKARQWRKPAVWPEPLRPGMAPVAMKYFRYELTDLKYGVLGVSPARLSQIEKIIKSY